MGRIHSKRVPPLGSPVYRCDPRPTNDDARSCVRAWLRQAPPADLQRRITESDLVECWHIIGADALRNAKTIGSLPEAPLLTDGRFGANLLPTAPLMSADRREADIAGAVGMSAVVEKRTDIRRPAIMTLGKRFPEWTSVRTEHGCRCPRRCGHKEVDLRPPMRPLSRAYGCKRRLRDSDRGYHGSSKTRRKTRRSINTISSKLTAGRRHMGYRTVKRIASSNLDTGQAQSGSKKAVLSSACGARRCRHRRLVKTLAGSHTLRAAVTAYGRRIYRHPLKEAQGQSATENPRRPETAKSKSPPKRQRRGCLRTDEVADLGAPSAHCTPAATNWLRSG